MYSQFERQYSDFLRNHLTRLQVQNNRSSEETLLSHVTSHLHSSDTAFSPTLSKSYKSDELARAHVGFAEELVEEGNHLLALSELCEAIKNSAATESLVLIVAVRIVVLSKLSLNYEMRADLKLLKSICCKRCLKTIFNSNSKEEQNSNDETHFSPITRRFDPIEQCPLTKLKRNILRELYQAPGTSTSVNTDEKSVNTSTGEKSHNPPRLCTPPDLVTSTVLSEEYNFVTSKLQIAESEERGRFVVAKEDLHIGDVLVVEEAQVWTVLPAKWSSHCQYCLNICRAPLPCPKCPDVVFCSVDCLSTDTVHQMECGYLPELQSLPKMVYLAFRTVLKYRRDIVHYSRKKDTSVEFAQLMSLITNFHSRSPVDITKRATLALFLSNILRNTLAVFSTCNKYSFINRPDLSAELCSRVSVGDVDICMGGCVKGRLELESIYNTTQIVLLKCLQSYPCNAHEISELQITKQFRYSANADIGAGAFPFLSLLNHSCNPNVVRHSVGRGTILRALRKIVVGEELLDNYGYHYATHAVPERRRALRSQYLFTCGCGPCSDRKNWPTFEDVQRSVTVRCCRCNSPLLKKRPTCGTCGKNASKALQKMDRVAIEASKFIQTFISDSDPSNSSIIFEFLKLCEIHAELPFRLYNECQEVIKQVWNLQSNSKTLLT